MLTLSLFFCALLLGPTSALQAVPTFTLDLDKQPLNRWDGAVDLIVQKYGWENSFGPVIDMYLPALNRLLPAPIKASLENHLRTTNPDLYGEVTGLGIQLNLSSTVMSMFTYFYELSHIDPGKAVMACAAILSLPANLSADILHGRNMDEEPAPGRNLTMNIAVTKGGKTLYKFVDWSWMTGGFATAWRENGVTLELNWSNDLPDLSPGDVINRILLPGTVPALQAFRVINDATMDFPHAVRFLANTNFAAPFYAIVTGTQRRGAIISIQANTSNTRVEYLNDTSSVSFKVQTNFDRWVPDSTEGIYPEGRRTMAESTMTMLGRERSGLELGVWMALSAYPVLNPSTMFSALMSVSKEPEIYVRDQIMVPSP